MINGIGVVGWGVGGIEAEAGMLGQPVYFLTPDVVGVHLKGKLREGVTATDLVLTVTELLRKQKVVGKFVEFFGEGTAALTLPDRATIANMAPEYGATMGFFPVDDVTVDYMRYTGRTDDEVDAFQSYFKAQGLYGVPKDGSIDYSAVVELDLSSIEPSLAGPKRPQDRIALSKMKETFNTLFSKPIAENGFNKPASELNKRYTTALPDRSNGVCVPISGGGSMDNAKYRTEMAMADEHPTASVRGETQAEMLPPVEIGHGDVLIAAITSCTNTSNPSVLLAAGLLAKKAVAKGLRVKPHIKTSLAPGSRVVTEYLTNAGLLEPLAQLGFSLAGYGCTTCIGNSGPLDAMLEEAIVKNDLVAAAVLSGNRNFEARIHGNIKANFLASPPLVVAYAIAGKMNINLDTEPLGTGKDGQPVYLKDIWPNSAEVQTVMKYAADPAVYQRLYSDLTKDLPLWNAIAAPTGDRYQWDDSTYIARPPFFDAATPKVGDIKGAKALALLGDSVTTDHISPAGSFKPTTPAGKYLQSKNVAVKDFNSYGARRGNHEVMMRGTFANVRIKNLMLPLKEDGSRVEGGYTLYKGEQMAIYDAAMKHIADGTPTVIFAGEEYGTGSSRDWAAKGTQLLGREGRHRQELRAHPPQQPGGHGRAAAAVQGQRQPRRTQPGRRRDFRPDRHQRQPQAAAGRDADHHAQGWQLAKRRAPPPYRYANRGGLLQEWRDSAVRVEGVGEQGVSVQLTMSQKKKPAKCGLLLFSTYRAISLAPHAGACHGVCPQALLNNARIRQTLVDLHHKIRLYFQNTNIQVSRLKIVFLGGQKFLRRSRIAYPRNDRFWFDLPKFQNLVPDIFGTGKIIIVQGV